MAWPPTEKDAEVLRIIDAIADFTDGDRQDATKALMAAVSVPNAANLLNDHKLLAASLKRFLREFD